MVRLHLSGTGDCGCRPGVLYCSHYVTGGLCTCIDDAHLCSEAVKGALGPRNHAWRGKVRFCFLYVFLGVGLLYTVNHLSIARTII